MGETLLIAGITGFFSSFFAVRVLPKYLTSAQPGRKHVRLLLAIVIGLLAYFCLYYYLASYALLESAIKSAVGVTLTIAGAFVCIYLAKKEARK